MSREQKEAIYLSLFPIVLGIILGVSHYYEKTKEETPPPVQQLDIDSQYAEYLGLICCFKGVSADALV